MWCQLDKDAEVAEMLHSIDGTFWSVEKEVAGCSSSNADDSWCWCEDMRGQVKRRVYRLIAWAFEWHWFRAQVAAWGSVRRVCRPAHIQDGPAFSALKTVPQMRIVLSEADLPRALGGNSFNAKSRNDFATMCGSVFGICAGGRGRHRSRVLL